VAFSGSHPPEREARPRGRRGGFPTRADFPNPYQGEVVHIDEAAPITSAAVLSLA
jgi:hypothetical protein